MKHGRHSAPPPAQADRAEDPRAEGAPEDGAAAAAETVESTPILAELERLRAREDELLRAIAEQQNVVRRRRQEMESSVRFAQESLVRELLPVLDDLDRAIAAMEQSAGDSIRAGVALVRDRLIRTLEQQGLTPIDPLGQPFDPELHDALAQRPAQGVAPGIVLEVAQPGYRFKDRVLRHAKVVVAGSAQAAESDGHEA